MSFDQAIICFEHDHVIKVTNCEKFLLSSKSMLKTIVLSLF